ncbi:MAG: hypothetical protein HQK83_20120 [Fibrobacteria bacterium]|nr:hypothetical protein [Fibrobacteria bacterium]
MDGAIDDVLIYNTVLDSVTIASLFSLNDWEGPTLTDNRDGRVYKKVHIGAQVWMAENLAYLPQVDNSSAGSEDVADGKYYYVYDYTPTGASENDEIANAKTTENYQTYGVLYNWYAAMDGASSSNSSPSGVRGVCPEGWHIPSDTEWTELENTVGNSSIAGAILKARSINGTDDYAFSVLPAGNRSGNGAFNYLDSNAYFWSATESNATNAWYRRLHSDEDGLYRVNYYQYYGLSVRCLKNEE